MSDNIENKIAEIFCSMLLSRGFKIISNSKSADNHEIIEIEPKDLPEVINLFKTHSEAGFKILISVIGTDYKDKFELIYQLYSPKLSKNLLIKVYLEKSTPEIESLSAIYTTADWHERETFDLLGIRFRNHPDLRRILLPHEWKGHPLRKDYVMDDERLVWNER